MNELIAIISAFISVAILVVLASLLARLESYLLIKEYNKRHKGKFDEHTDPRVASKRYQYWYVENFADMKEDFSDDEKKGNTNEK